MSPDFVYSTEIFLLFLRLTFSFSSLVVFQELKLKCIHWKEIFETKTLQIHLSMLSSWCPIIEQELVLFQWIFPQNFLHFFNVRLKKNSDLKATIHEYELFEFKNHNFENVQFIAQLF